MNVEEIAGISCEFPRVSNDVLTRPYRYAWMAAHSGAYRGLYDRVMKLDVESGAMRTIDPAHAELRNARDVIARQVGNLTRLVDDLLDVSRITRSKINVELERLDLRSVVMLSVETSRPQILAGEIRGRVVVDVNT